MLPSYGIRTFLGRPSRLHSTDTFASTDWRDSQHEGPPAAFEQHRTRRRTGLGRIVGAIASTVAGAAMLAATYFVPTPPPSMFASYTHTHELEVVDEHRRSTYELGENAPDSLWKTAEAYIGEDLAQEPAERIGTLVAATDALAQDNGYCAPSTWAAEHPDRVSNGSLERYLEDAPCTDGSANPHYIERGTQISTKSLERFVEDSSRTIVTPIRATVYEQGSAALAKGALITGAALLFAGAAGLALSAPSRDEKRAIARDILDHDPNDRPQMSGSLYYGHAYLVSKDYLAADRDTPLAGAAKQAVERKAVRLNRLAAALENGYVSSSLEDTVREAVGAETLTKRTAESYVADLAGMGHAAAKQYLEMRSSEDELERNERKKSVETRAKKRTRRRSTSPKGKKRSGN